MPMVEVTCEEGVVVTHPDLVNLRGCRIGAQSRIGPFVEIMPGTVVGRRCKVSSHSFLCGGVRLGDGVFLGHGVAVTDEEVAPGESCPPTEIGAGASIGSRVTILAGCTIGRGAVIGAGAVVTEDVPDHALVVGVPGRVVGDARTVRASADPGPHRDEEADTVRTAEGVPAL